MAPKTAVCQPFINLLRKWGRLSPRIASRCRDCGDRNSVQCVFHRTTGQSTLTLAMDRQVFLPPTPPSYDASGAGVPTGATLVWDRDTLLGLWCDSGVDSSDTALLWLHGNACDAGQEAPACVELSRALGVVVFAAEYPGYGPCSGQPTTASIDTSVAAALALLRQRGFVRVAICGRSIGTGPAMRLARNMCESDAPPLLVALWSPITSVRDVVKGFLPSAFGFLTFAVDKRWDGLDDIAHITCPTLFIGGARDQLTPPSMQRALVEASGAEFVQVHTNDFADHNVGWDVLSDVGHPLAGMLRDVSGAVEEVETELAPEVLVGWRRESSALLERSAMP